MHQHCGGSSSPFAIALLAVSVSQILPAFFSSATATAICHSSLLLPSKSVLLPATDLLVCFGLSVQDTDPWDGKTLVMSAVALDEVVLGHIIEGEILPYNVVR